MAYYGILILKRTRSEMALLYSAVM